MAFLVKVSVRRTAIGSGRLKEVSFRRTEIMKGVRMNRPVPVSIALMLVLALQAVAQDVTAKYPIMAPLEQYLMDRAAEISLARGVRRRNLFLAVQRSLSLFDMVTKRRFKAQMVSSV